MKTLLKWIGAVFLLGAGVFCLSTWYDLFIGTGYYMNANSLENTFWILFPILAAVGVYAGLREIIRL